MERRLNPSGVHPINLLDVLPRATWYALARAADIPLTDVDAACSGVVSRELRALIAWITPATWVLRAAQRAALDTTGLHIRPSATEAGALECVVSDAVNGAVVAALMTDGATDLGIPWIGTLPRTRGRVLPTTGESIEDSGAKNTGAADGGVAESDA